MWQAFIVTRENVRQSGNLTEYFRLWSFIQFSFSNLFTDCITNRAFLAFSAECNIYYFVLIKLMFNNFKLIGIYFVHFCSHGADMDSK